MWLLGRVVRLASRFASLLAGPFAYLLIRLARCVPALVAGLMRGLASQATRYPSQ